MNEPTAKLILAATTDANASFFQNLVGDSNFWAAVAFILFILLLVRVKVPQAIMNALDKKQKEIGNELEDAKRLREEAQALLAEYERKRKDAELEAEEIVQAAKADAERLTDEANAQLKSLIERRTAAVEAKISQAEARAVAKVRSQSAEVAVQAARTILQTISPEKKASLVSNAIEDVHKQLN